MLRRIMCFALCFCILPLSGCSKARHIDSAALAETITVERRGSAKIYTFYLLSGKEKPWGIEIEADRFEEAKRLAETVYIPNMSMAKLKLMLIEQEIAEPQLFEDVAFAASDAVFSPLSYVALCDSDLLGQMKKRKDLPELIEKELILIKNNNENINIDFLSVFNEFARQGSGGFEMTLVNSENELKATRVFVKNRAIPGGE